MKKISILLTALFLLVCASACAAGVRPSESQALQTGRQESVDSPVGSPAEIESTMTEKKEETAMKLHVQIGDRSFAATLEDNAAVREWIEMMQKAPVTIEMRDYSGFEKVGALGKSLSADDRQTTTAPGDIVLYNGNQIVMFYGSNSWSYTRLGHIDDLTGWTDALGNNNITAVFTVAES